MAAVLAFPTAHARNYGRRSVNVAVNLDGVEGRVTDVSEAGLFVETGADLAAGDEVMLGVPGAFGVVRSRARVRYRRRAGMEGGAGVSLQFVSMGASDRASAASCVAALLDGEVANDETSAAPESGVHATVAPRAVVRPLRLAR
ncbi:MAG TPA: PilZ domain-containing protein [Polyangiaceae bacterium]|jgi:hypothetical protein